MFALPTRRQFVAQGLAFGAGALLTPNRRSDANAAARNKKTAPHDDVQIIPRRAWTATQPNYNLAVSLDGVLRITLHHTGVAAAHVRSRDDAARFLNAIRDNHVARGWADIGYHFAIDPAGRIWEARPLTLQGAHVRGHNEHNLGIVLLGNFEEEQPTPAALGALTRFVADRMKRHGVPLARLFTHRELGPTLCPGRALHARIARARQPGGAFAAIHA